MSRQYFSETVTWATASGTAVANTTVETILIPNTNIPSNFLQDGRCLRIRAFGGYGTTVTPTIIFNVKLGGVSGSTLARSATITTTSGVGGGASMTALWSAEILVQTRVNGSSGSLMTNGVVTLFTSTAGTAGTVTNYGMDCPLASGQTGGTTPIAVTPVDLTAAADLSFTVTWGTANAANSIQCHNFSIEALN